MTKQADSPDDILALYADGPAQLEAALKGITEAELNLALTADSWSIRQIVHHLADGDDIWKMCTKMALGNSEGVFNLQWYWDNDQMEWSVNWQYAGRSIESSLALLRANRRHIVELVQPVSDTWKMSVRCYRPDGKEERISIGEVLSMQTRHIIGHVQDIKAIRLAHSV
jgi:hypothetical protein